MGKTVFCDWRSSCFVVALARVDDLGVVEFRGISLRESILSKMFTVGALYVEPFSIEEQ